MTFDVISAIEACYAPAGDDEEWLAGLLEALAPIDLGCGVGARIQDRVARGGLSGRTHADRGVPRTWFAAAQLTGNLIPARLALEFYRPWPPFQRALVKARRMGRMVERMVRLFFVSQGVDDSWGILAGGPGQSLLDVGIPFRGRRRLPPRTVHQLRFLSAHLTTALRLHDRIRGPRRDGAEVEAVLSPGGHVCHAEAEARAKDARERLVEAVRRVERARGSLRRSSPEEAADLWTGLVDGRWTLLDTCEADGRRIVLARRNEPRIEDPRLLTDRERHVLAQAALGHSNKYVAYLLGLAPSTVATHLAEARRKLGLRTRRELLAFGRTMDVPASAPGARAASGDERA